MVGNSGSEVEGMIRKVRLLKSGETPHPSCSFKYDFPESGSKEAWHACLARRGEPS